MPKDATLLPTMLHELFAQRAHFKQLAPKDISSSDSMYNKCRYALSQLKPEELTAEIVVIVIKLLKAGIGNPNLGMAMIKDPDGSINPLKQDKASRIAVSLGPSCEWR